MADRKAAIKLDLKTDGFKRGMKEAEKAADDSAKKSGGAWKDALTAGAKGGTDAVKGLFSSIKSAAAGVAGLLGGIGFASLVKGSIDAQKSFKQLAFNISQGTGQAVKWSTLQRTVQKVAGDAKVDVDKLGAAYRTAFKETGSVEFANETLAAVAKTSKATGADLEVLGKLSGVLGQKFGVSSSEIGDGLALMVQAANKGGASIEDLSEDFAEIGGKAKTLGLQGPEGIRRMVGFLNLAKKETGNFQQAMTALPQILDQIIERTSEGVVTSGGKVPIKVQAVDKDGNPRDPFDIIQDILKETQGDASKLGEFGFGGEGVQTLLGISKGFQAELKATGGDVEAASAVLERSLMENAGSLDGYNAVLKEAAVDSPADQLADATNKLKEAFTKPEMIAAIEKLAASLPKLAEVLADVVGFAAESPVLAGAVFTGGTFAKGAAGAGIQSLLASAFKSGGGTLGAGVEAGAAKGGKSMAGAIGAAGTAAAVAVALAVDQGQKLAKDLQTHDQDLKDERTNLLENAERQGSKSVRRQRSGAERLFAAATGGSGAAEEIVFRDPKTGAVKARPVSATDEEFRKKGGVDIPFEDLQPGSVQARRIDNQIKQEQTAAVGGEQRVLFSDVVNQAEQKFGRKLRGGERDKLRDIRLGSGSGAAVGGAGGQAGIDAAIAQLSKSTRASTKPVVAALRQELRVRVTNADEIKPSTGPTPGSAPKAQ